MKLIRLTQVMEYTGLTRSTVYKFIAEGNLLNPVMLGSRVAAWVEAEVLAWIESKVNSRDSVGRS